MQHMRICTVIVYAHWRIQHAGGHVQGKGRVLPFVLICMRWSVGLCCELGQFVALATAANAFNGLRTGV